ncbi:MAG: hypothetical protein QOF65_638 [Thermoleophilaceae bacterium]|jgi:NRPS condensation-like uncharacterized protein|nr:hypothetical protein [Thermoleophilaceae bacterium]MEA2436082.1 hypothetical protein [Thermoleophilaceae bacterium]
METAPLNVLDELYLHLDREDEPWSVHLEVRAEGRVDAERLEAAVREAALRHPIARARLGSSRFTDVRYDWEIADELGDVDLEEVDCTDAADADRAREELLSRTPSLESPGPFSLLLAHEPGGDTIVLNLHHAAGDGLAALRLMGSIARAYGGEADPLPPEDPLEVRDIQSLAGGGSVKERIARGRAMLDYLGRGVSTPARIARDGEGDAPGYGFERVTFEPDEVRQIVERRRGGATVNDVLLGALAVTVRRWNDDHGESTGAVYLMMPINLRPPEWRFEVVGNFASYVSVRVGGSDHESLDAAVASASASTRRIKDGGIAGLIVDVFDPPTLLPTGLKRRMQDLIPLTGNIVVDTAVLSNLGRIDDVPHLGDAGAVREVWFSPPGRMPLGASLGAVTVDGRLFVTLRYRHALFDRDAATRFLADFKATLVD